VSAQKELYVVGRHSQLKISGGKTDFLENGMLFARPVLLLGQAIGITRTKIGKKKTSAEITKTTGNRQDNTFSNIFSCTLALRAVSQIQESWSSTMKATKNLR